jgi:hypothetical protein
MRALEDQSVAQWMGKEAPAPDPEATIYIRGYNMMGGTVNWLAFPIIASFLNARDKEMFVFGVLTVAALHADAEARQPKRK